MGKGRRNWGAGGRGDEVWNVGQGKPLFFGIQHMNKENMEEGILGAKLVREDLGCWLGNPSQAFQRWTE